MGPPGGGGGGGGVIHWKVLLLGTGRAPCVDTGDAESEVLHKSRMGIFTPMCPNLVNNYIWCHLSAVFSTTAIWPAVCSYTPTLRRRDDARTRHRGRHPSACIFCLKVWQTLTRVRGE